MKHVFKNGVIVNIRKRDEFRTTSDWHTTYRPVTFMRVGRFGIVVCENNVGVCEQYRDTLDVDNRDVDRRRQHALMIDALRQHQHSMLSIIEREIAIEIA